MAKKEQTYEQAMSRLEEITRQIESGELNIDSLCDSLKEAQELMRFCKEKLYKTDENIRKMLDSVTDK